MDRVAHLGFEVRVELISAEGEANYVQTTRSKADELGLPTARSCGSARPRIPFSPPKPPEASPPPWRVIAATRRPAVR